MSNEDIAPNALPCGFITPTVSISRTDIDTEYPTVELLKDISLTGAKSKRFGVVSHARKNADIVDLVKYNEDRDYLDGGIFHCEYVAKNTTSYEYGTTINTSNLLLSGSFAGFDFPMYDGFDAKDITVQEAFVSNVMLSANPSSITNPAHRAIKQALDMVADPDVIDMNLLCVPGLQEESLTGRILDICKARGDCMAVIDLLGDYQYPHDTESGEEIRPQNTVDVRNNLTAREVDNSYGAAYFPAVFSAADGIFLPSSVAALGALAGTESRAALWFAPAGFNRGGLTELNSGIGVSKTAMHLVASDRDDLYDANINPIATFPNEGVVIFGQKTLQSTPSALDRVNVRRLVNYIKKFVSRASTRVIFEPNVESTWNSFKGVVEPFLASIKSNFGLDDAKVVLDSSTTTADLIDRNIMYCKIFLKPTRAIEYVAIDVAVTNSGASFAE